MSLKQQFLGSMSGHLLPKEAKNQSAVAKKQLSFNPYNMGGGSIASISGTDYCLIASDCRVATIGAFHIDARNVSRVLQLTEKCVIACAGVPADITTIYKTLQTRLTMYNQDHGRDMSVHSIAQMLSTILYQKRFFPHLIEPLVAGLDNDGKGWTYTFDYIGSFDYAVMACCGTGRGILQPVLDKQIGGDKRHNPSESEPLPREEATKALKDAFTAAGERDVYTGDSVKFFLITKEGIEKERFGLRLD